MDEKYHPKVMGWEKMNFVISFGMLLILPDIHFCLTLRIMKLSVNLENQYNYIFKHFHRIG